MIPATGRAQRARSWTVPRQVVHADHGHIADVALRVPVATRIAAPARALRSHQALLQPVLSPSRFRGCRASTTDDGSLGGARPVTSAVAALVHVVGSRHVPAGHTEDEVSAALGAFLTGCDVPVADDDASRR
jgi:hypothetical protein